MRLVHTADIHLDACFASLGAAPGFGTRRRQGLRDVLHLIVTRAREWPADALLIPGDLFDHEYVTRDTVAFIRSEFEALGPTPVVIAPGNHDPYVHDSPYATEPWPDNVFIFSQPAWSVQTFLEGRLVVHGFAFDGFDISSNPFGSLRIPGDEAVHVAVAHGTERAHQPPDGKTFAPFHAVDAEDDGLAYLALGHFHAPVQIEGDFNTCMYYSGAPEGHDFTETGPHYYIEVEIVDGAVQVRRVPSAQVAYTTCTIDCTGYDTAEQIVEAIQSHSESASLPQIARVMLVGFCPASVRSRIPGLPDAVEGEFEYLNLVDETRPIEDYQELARENTTLGAYVGKLNAEVEDAPDDARRCLAERAREVGVAAYRGQTPAIRGMELDGA